MIEVVAALIIRDGKFLICQRPPQKARGLLWEFVGGKVEAGESLQAALQRECMEELNVLVRASECILNVTHVYPDVTVHLSLLKAELVSGELELLEHIDAKWISVDDIPSYAFCPADIAFLTPILERRQELQL